ncbi:Hypothetical protein A7982_06169 [Minicystis rosea]|nr:Hypothetical protein A7982_06169 [Minicystis rosea]
MKSTKRRASEQVPSALAAEAETAKTAFRGINALSPYAYGGVGPDGHAWFCCQEVEKGPRRLLRYVDGHFEDVGAPPNNAMSMAALGDALFAIGPYEDGAFLRDGVWSTFPMPDLADGVLVGDGRHALWFVSRHGNVFSWNGSGFEAVQAPAHPGAQLVADVDGALLLVGGRNAGTVTRVDGKGVSKLPKAPIEHLTSACRVGDWLVVLETFLSTRVFVLSRRERKAKWQGPFDLGNDRADLLVPLATGQVLAYSRWLRPIVTIDPATGAVTPAGKRTLINGGATSVVVPTSGGGALFVGGLLGTGIKDDDPPMQPQLWRDGKVTAMVGFEHELAAQAEDQEKRSTILHSVRNATSADIDALLADDDDDD